MKTTTGAADPFDRVLRATKRGRRHPITDPTRWPGVLFASVEPMVRALREQLVREARFGPPVPEILAGVVDDSSFNARALTYDGHRVVAVNYGSLILIHALANRLFSQPEFFPWVGDVSKEDAARRFNPLSNNAMKYMRAVIKQPGSIHPHDDDRRRAADLLTRLGGEFLVAHEVAHICGGHLGWMRQQLGRLDASEAMRTLKSPSRALSRQALEMDADSFAMNHVLDLTLFLAARPAEPASGRRVIRNPEDALRTALLCGMVMMGSFYFPRRVVGKWPLLSHPPTGVRLGLNILAADTSLRRRGLTDLRAATTGNQAWVAQLANLALVSIWKRIGHTNRQDELKASFGPPGQRHVGKILEEWGRIGGEVRRYGSGFTPAPTPRA